MKKALYILVFCFAGCASQAPLDDAYYWPDKTASASTSTTSATSDNSVSSTTSSGSDSSTNPSTLEYVNVQDTTVTIRIKK